MSEEEEKEINTIAFSVDAGIIERLGRELVSRPETAVSELIKNCYDADSQEVEVEFINSNLIGGKLIVDDNGLGMTFKQLTDGFMRLSSTDKVHNPNSERYKRLRAGRKGIGRFATQRLGNKLVITTQTLAEADALELVINWKDYEIDKDIQKIQNSFKNVSKLKAEGTRLVIEGLKDVWDEASIKRVYRFISDLLQPEYLSESAKKLNSATKVNEGFSIKIYSTIGKEKKLIADDLTIVFNKSLAVIEGSINSTGDGVCSVKSSSLNLYDVGLPVFNKIAETDEVNEAKPHESLDNTKIEELQNQFLFAKNVEFKVYYFIYKRPQYYRDITKPELNAVEKISKTAGGIKLYRNGFKVLPYGDPGDDWLHLDSSYLFQSGVTNIPLFNRNFFGFVEIIDTTGNMFQETASREGLLHNNAYHELVYFIGQCILTARSRIAEKIFAIREQEKKESENEEKDFSEQIEELETQLTYLLSSEDADINPIKKSQIEGLRASIQKIKEAADFMLEEIGMLRILAAMGLLIGEFSHEIAQYTPSIRGYLSAIINQIKNNENPTDNLASLNTLLSGFISYITYFKSSIRKNTSRDLSPINLIDTVNDFSEIIKPDIAKLYGEVIVDFDNFDVYTLPMHFSEWTSILFNLYTNSKKAIKRADVKGKIRILVGRTGNSVFLEFSDNGDGIPQENNKRIFNAFFTTSAPNGFEPVDIGVNHGNGLGLKIVKDIIEGYKGEILLEKPEEGYSTTFRISVPAATPIDLNHYGL